MSLRNYKWYCERYPGCEFYLKHQPVLDLLNKLTEEQLYIDSVCLVNKEQPELPKLLYEYWYHDSLNKKTGKYDRIRIKTLFPNSGWTYRQYFRDFEDNNWPDSHVMVDIGGNIYWHNKNKYYMIDDVNLCKKAVDEQKNTKFIAIKPSILELYRHKDGLKEKLSSKEIHSLYICDYEYLMYEEPDKRKYKNISNFLVTLIQLFNVQKQIKITLSRRVRDTTRIKILHEVARQSNWWYPRHENTITVSGRRKGIDSVSLTIIKV